MNLKEYHINSLEEDTVYWNVLCQTSSQSVIPREKTKVLAVACGKLTEGKVLSEFFNTEEVYGIDIDVSSTNCAKQNNSHIDEENIQVGDAKSIQARFRQKFDVITLRHPHLTENPENWKKILESCLKALKSDGILIVSTFTLTELQIILRMCLLESVKIPIATNNKYLSPLNPLFDAYICVIRKGDLVLDLLSRLQASFETK